MRKILEFFALIFDIIFALLYILLVIALILVGLALAIPGGILYGSYYLIFKRK